MRTLLVPALSSLLAGCGSTSYIFNASASRDGSGTRGTASGGAAGIDSTTAGSTTTTAGNTTSPTVSGAATGTSPTTQTVTVDGSGSGDGSGPTIIPLATASCSTVDDYANDDWLQTASRHFVVHYFANTAAAADLDSIVSKREAAYADIRNALGITAEPVIDIFMSPNRVAAAAHDVAFGMAFPAAQREEVIYTGAPDSYEVLRYGHELTHVLAYQLDTANPLHLPLLDEGLAEYFDQSHRDMHAAYAEQLIAQNETRSHVASFEDSDLQGSNYGRAGSFVQFIMETYGTDAFVAMWREAGVQQKQGWLWSPTFGWIDSAAALTQMLDAILQDTVGVGWDTVQPLWRAKVLAALAAGPQALTGSDSAAITNVVRVMDDAINNHDADEYRSTMDGFYCDWGGEAMRQRIAARVVDAYTGVSSSIQILYPTGVHNFTEAYAVVFRRETGGAVTAQNMYFEHFPIGWRVTWAPDWY